MKRNPLQTVLHGFVTRTSFFRCGSGSLFAMGKSGVFFLSALASDVIHESEKKDADVWLWYPPYVPISTIFPKSENRNDITLYGIVLLDVQEVIRI